jgi:hypothetical protein
MTKNNDGKDLVNEVKAITKNQRKAKLMNSKPVVFVKRLLGTLFALAILGLGAAAAIYAKEIDNDIYSIAVMVSAACAIVDGAYLLYKALMSDKE